MTQIERSPERDAALTAMLPHVPTHGWTTAALRAGLIDAGEPPDAAAWMFSGPTDMVEAFIDHADRAMEAAAADLPETRLSARIRAIIALRLQQAAPHRAAIRRATALLALPMNAPAAARSLARTVDAIWHAAGDTSADFAWYTKRASLAAVYAATLLTWLRHDEWSDPGDAQTLAFLDRRLAGLAAFGKLKARLSARLSRLVPAALHDHPPTTATAPANPPPVPG